MFCLKNNGVFSTPVKRQILNKQMIRHGSRHMHASPPTHKITRGALFMQRDAPKWNHVCKCHKQMSIAFWGLSWGNGAKHTGLEDSYAPSFSTISSSLNMIWRPHLLMWWIKRHIGWELFTSSKQKRMRDKTTREKWKKTPASLVHMMIYTICGRVHEWI